MGNYEIEHGIVKIKSVADLSIKDLEDLEKIEPIYSIYMDSKCTKDNYSVFEYKKIYQKLLELTEGIDDEWSKTKKFIFIYKQVSSQIEYDHIAGYPQKGDIEQQDYSKKNQYDSRNLKNGLLKGKCVCEGYSEILRNACLLKGVPSIKMVGPTGSEEHAWNQVEIDEGKWIEVDSTWDHNHGTDYIGTDKQKFCKEHGRTIDSPLAIINTEEHIVSELDLNGFINSELGLPSNYSYSKEEQVKLIGLIETRDIDRKDIKTQLEKTLESRDFRIKSEQEFEQECGYSIDDLKNLGFSNDEIIKMECKFNGRTGERLDRKAIVKQMIDKQSNFEKEFEQECGYSIDDLKNLGFSNDEIIKMECKFNGRTGEKLNRKTIVEQKVFEQNKTHMKVEKTKYIKEQAEGLHPDTIKALIDFTEQGELTLEEAYQIIDLKKERVVDINQLKAKMSQMKNEKLYIEFEQECGYSIDDLKNLGFSNDEITEMQKKFNGQTGERLDRKAIVEQKIFQKNLPKAYNGASIKQSDIRESYDILSKTKTELEHSKAEDLTYDR